MKWGGGDVMKKMFFRMADAPSIVLFIASRDQYLTKYTNRLMSPTNFTQLRPISTSSSTISDW